MVNGFNLQPTSKAQTHAMLGIAHIFSEACRFARHPPTLWGLPGQVVPFAGYINKLAA